MLYQATHGGYGTPIHATHTGLHVGGEVNYLGSQGACVTVHATGPSIHGAAIHGQMKGCLPNPFSSHSIQGFTDVVVGVTFH